MRTHLLYAIAIMTGAAVPGSASAFWPCGPVIPVPVTVQYQTVTKYRTEYRTGFKEVQHTVVRKVPETVMKEVAEAVVVPYVREETRERTVMVPVTHIENRQRTVKRTELQTQVRERTVMVPET